MINFIDNRKFTIPYITFMKKTFLFIYFVLFCILFALSQSKSDDYVIFSGRINQIINNGQGRKQEVILVKSYPSHYKVLLFACDALGHKTGEVFNFTTDENGFFSLKLLKGNYLMQSESPIYTEKVLLIKVFENSKKNSIYELYQYNLSR